VVSDEPLADHDCKRLLHAYGVPVTRQAPVNTSTAALRTMTKLGLPVVVLPPQPPSPYGEGLAAAQAQERAAVVCSTQAEVKRHATLLLAKFPYILLREVVPPGPRLRALINTERSLGPVLRLGRVAATEGDEAWEAALVPLLRGEARELAAQLGSDSSAIDAHPQLAQLLAQLSACAVAHDLRLDLLLALEPTPVVIYAAGELKRAATRR
jgi:hypothetical protein